MSNKLNDIVLAVTLENAVKYGGRPNKGSVIGKVLFILPQYRGKLDEIMPIIDSVIKKVSGLSIEEQMTMLKQLEHILPKKDERIDELPALPYAEEGKVITRFAPNPDFVLHLGSVRPLLFSYLYARKYNGKFIVRFEDTDPRTKKPKIEYYDLILKDIKWLGIRPDEIYYQSDRLEIYYDVARKLIEKGYAYICRCKPVEFKNYISQGKACPHREETTKINLNLFDKMVNGELLEGSAVLRIKTDLSHPNPSIRDWPALRIIDTRKYPHPRSGSKYFVWPLYNFSCPVDDHFMKVSHVIRGVEHKVNEEKQAYIYRYMGWQPPYAIHHGRISIPDGVLSKSKILNGIKMGIYSGIDDPQLATLAALRRRGFKPDAIRNVIMRGGLKPSLSVIDWSLLAAENRVLIDKEANRYFVVRNPLKAIFRFNEDRHEIHIRKHPDFPDRGHRILRLNIANKYVNIFIDEGDKQVFIIDKKLRLIGLGNFIVSGYRSDGTIKLKYLDNDVAKAKRKRFPFIHWVPADDNIDVELVYPDRRVYGYGEKELAYEHVDSAVQLERLGYFRIDELKNNKLVLFFTHN
jgi:glutamyl-tRNA synthetase